MNKTQIPPEILQEVLDSASNAADKGLSQFFTPLEFARHLSVALPPHRPVLTDLTCGAGHLLRAATNGTTHGLLGADIDACTAAQATLTRTLNSEDGRSKVEDGKDLVLSSILHPQSSPSAPLPLTRLQRDLTLLYPDLVDVACRFDLVLLNPPYRLFWRRARLALLAESDLYSVRQAAEAQENTEAGGCPADAMDSTIATLLIALDRLTARGEGFLIGNHATLERLIFAAGAPYAAAARHIWARVILPGNPMTGLAECNFQHDATYHTEVIYFARDHVLGPRTVLRWTAPWPVGTDSTRSPIRDAVESVPTSAFPLPNRAFRGGMSPRQGYECEDTGEAWGAVKEQLAAATARQHPFNLWLAADGTIATQLSRYQQRSRKTDKQEAARLHALNGKQPMQLVMQRDERKNLLHAAREAGWAVCPQLLAAVEQAIADYQAARAPLYPLPEIQRLGYIDEQDYVECRKSLGPFQAGEHYPLRTQTVKVVRKVTKPNATTGEPEKLEYTGYELAIYLRPDPRSAGEPDEESPERAFLDATLRDETVTVEDGRRGYGRRGPMNRSTRFSARPSSSVHPPSSDSPIDFTLQELCAHFVIPDVPDVSQCRPEEFTHYLAMLGELERVTEELDAALAA